MTLHLRKRSQAPEVVIVGDVNIDVVAQIDFYPPHGDDAQALRTKICLGGTSLNTAIVLARLGIETALIARVGRDVFGDFAIAEMERNGVSAQWLQRDDTALTGVAYCAITPDGQRTLFGGGGPNRNLRTETLSPELFTQARWLHLASYALLAEPARSTVRQAQGMAQAAGVSTSLDIGLAPWRLIPDLLMELAPTIEVLMPSEQPLMPTHKLVLRKLGAEGCEVITHDSRLHVPTFHVNVIDTTGAGDAFDAGFIAGRVRRLDVRASALLANACGAAAVTVLGAGDAFPAREVVIELLRDHAPAGWQDAAQDILNALNT